MKKFLRIFLISIFFTAGALAVKAGAMPPSDSARDEAIASRMIIRIHEIQAMDKTSLSPSEKRDLRKELTSMKKQASGLNSRVSISIAAIIIAVLLLILILT